MAKTNSKFMTVAEIAEAAGVSKPAVFKWITPAPRKKKKRGIPQMPVAFRSERVILVERAVAKEWIAKAKKRRKVEETRRQRQLAS